MKFYANNAAIIAALTTVMQVVQKKPKRPIFPILSCLKISAMDGRVTLLTTNLDAEITASVTSEVEFSGTACVDAQRLQKFVKALPKSADVVFDMFDGNLLVWSGSVQTKIPLHDADAFPDPAELGIPKTDLLIPMADMRRLVGATAHAMANKDVRYFLNGMLLHIINNELRTVATDAFRLSIERMDLPSALPDTKAIVPRDAALLLQKMLKVKGLDKIRVQLFANNASFTLGETIFKTKLIDSTYVNYEKVIPNNLGEICMIDTESLKNALKSMGAGVHLRAENDVLHVNDDDSAITIACTGDLPETWLNAKHLLDALPVSGIVKMGNGGGQAPVVMPREQGLAVIAPWHK